MEPTLPLEGLYLYLVRNGFPLSVRDYQDAVTALQLGHGLHSRAKLRWLCQTLWARTDQETSRLEHLFRELPEPLPEVVDELSGRTDARRSSPRAADPRAAARPSAPAPTAVQ